MVKLIKLFLILFWSLTLIASLTLFSACSSQQAEVPSRYSPSASYTPVSEPAVTGAAASQPPQTNEVAPEPAKSEPTIAGRLFPEDGLKTVTLVPVGEAKDEDIVKAMSLLKVELAARPELKVKEISRSGSGKESVVTVQTELPSTKPAISMINAIINRERFEGRLGEKVLFDNNDLRFVCRIPACAGVEDISVCPYTPAGYACAWTFGIVVWEDAGRQIAEAVKGLPTRMDEGEEIIAQPINLYLNNQLMDYVYVPANMTDSPITDMTFSGNATAATSKEAQAAAISEMDRVRNTMSKKVMAVEMKVLE